MDEKVACYFYYWYGATVEITHIILLFLLVMQKKYICFIKTKHYFDLFMSF